MEHQMCDFCENTPITLKCLECKKNTFLCDECYAQSHKVDNKKLHKIMRMTPEELHKALQATPSDGLSIIENMCAQHEEAKKFICKACEKTVCSCCLLIGEHKGHEAVLFKEVAKHVQSKYGGFVNEYSGLIVQIKGVKAEAFKKQVKLKQNLAEAKAMLDKGIEEIIKAFEKKRQELHNELDYEYSQIALPVKQLDELLDKAEGKMKKVKSLLEETEKGITQDRYDSLATVKIESSKNLVEEVKGVEDTIKPLPECVSKPVFDLIKVKDAMELGICLKIPYLNVCNVPLTLIKNWKVVYILSRSGGHSGVTFDMVKGILYTTEKSQDTLIKAYSNMDDLLKNKVLREISLDKKYEGTYFVAYNGFFYYAIENSGQIAQADISTGKTNATLTIPNASKHNGGGHFYYGYYTDIALLFDAFTKTIYVMYQDLSTFQCKISEIIHSPTGLSLGQTWVLPGKSKNNFGFALVSMNHLYLGSAYNAPIIDYDYNLKLSNWESISPIKLPSDMTYITHVMSTPDHTLLVSDSNKGIFCIRPEEKLPTI